MGRGGSEGSSSIAETVLVQAEERCSEGEAGCGGVEGEFSSGGLSLRSWLHIQREAFRRSSECGTMVRERRS